MGKRGSSCSAILLALGFTLLVCSAAAETYVVGDSKGWGFSVSYDTWSAGKTFAAGDTLVFNYPAGVHNVVAASASEYQSCKASSSAAAAAAAATTAAATTTTGKHSCGCDCAACTAARAAGAATATTTTTSCGRSCGGGCSGSGGHQSSSSQTKAAAAAISTTRFELKRGVNYFISGVPGHCAAGMKLRVVAN